MPPLRMLYVGFAALWTLCAMLSTLTFWTQVRTGAMQVRGFDPRLIEILRMQAGAWIAAALLTPALVRTAARLPFRSGRRWPMLGLHLLGFVLFALVSTALSINIGLLLRGRAPQWPTAELFVSRTSGSLVLLCTEYVVIVGVTFAFVAHHEARRRAALADELTRTRVTLERDLAAARLLVLRQQLQPHFLFNALNAVSGLIDEDPAAARRVLARIADLLRFALERTDTVEATLGEELDFVDRYLAVERARLGDRLRVSFGVPAVLLGRRLPSFALQPLVENAVRHGIAMLPGGGAISIGASASPEALFIWVRNDAPQAVSPAKEGVGLGGLRARLSGLYGGRADLFVGRDRHGQFEVRLRVPVSREAA
jgi:hypothetical protein